MKKKWSFIACMKYLLIFSICIVAISCNKGKTDTPIVTDSVIVTPTKSFTAADATTAFNSFNVNFYSTTDKLYYSNTGKSDIAAIWTQAVYWDMVMNAYQRTKDTSYLRMVSDIYDGGFKRYDGYNWNNTSVWFIYDDMMWWVISLTNAYQITGNTAYLDNAKAGFERIWNGAYDTDKGGMFWDFVHSGKNSCINYPTVIAAMKLYAITRDPAYFTKAKNVYAWARTNLFNAQTGRVADNKIGDTPGYSDYTYNYGTCIGASMLLYKATDSAVYLSDAKLTANYVKNTMCNFNGILPAEGDWNEQGVLKSILAQYLVLLLPEDSQGVYAKWIDKNINLAWQNRDPVWGIMYRDYTMPCPKGSIQSYEASSGVAFMQLYTPL